MIIAAYVVLAAYLIFYFGFAIMTKSEKALGWALVPLVLFVGIVLATSDKVKNRVDVTSQSVSIEPRLKNIETVLIKTDTVQTKIIKEQTTIIADQKQLKKMVESMIELATLERKSPKPMILWGPKSEKESKEYDRKIEEEKKKLREIVDTTKQ